MRDPAQIIRADLQQSLLEALARLAREPGGTVGRLPAPFDVGGLQRIDVAAGTEDRLLQVFRVDLVVGHPSHRLVEHVIRARDVGVTVRTEIKRAAGHARLRVATISATLLAQLAMQKRVAEVVRQDEQGGGVWMHEADRLENSDVERDRHRRRARLGRCFERGDLRRRDMRAVGRKSSDQPGQQLLERLNHGLLACHDDP